MVGIFTLGIRNLILTLPMSACLRHMDLRSLLCLPLMPLGCAPGASLKLTPKLCRLETISTYRILIPYRFSILQMGPLCDAPPTRLHEYCLLQHVFSTRYYCTLDPTILSVALALPQYPLFFTSRHLYPMFVLVHLRPRP